VLRQQLALPATRESKELRRLIVRLERRQRERDRQRDRSTKREPHWDGYRRSCDCAPIFGAISSWRSM